MNILEKAFNEASKIDPHQTHPNPRVGCVVVRDEEIIARGCHRMRGGDHAEVDALQKLEGQDLSDCTVYVTLEPCDCFEGKSTGSCTQLLINAGIAKVVIGALDPRFGGRNVEKLRAAGVEVVIEDCHYHTKLNPFYDHFFCTKKPFVCAKVACTIDGMISVGTKTEQSNDRYEIITNSASRKQVHIMRSQYAAILTTTKTIVADNAKLDVRHVPGSNPDIIVLGRKEDIPEGHAFWGIPHVCHSVRRGGSESQRSQHPSRQNGLIGAEPRQRNVYFFDTYDLEYVIEKCGERGINSIMTELGPTVLTQLLKHDLVDKVMQFIAPNIFGKGVSLVTESVDFSGFSLEEVEDICGDVLVRWKKEGDYDRLV